ERRRLQRAARPRGPRAQDALHFQVQSHLHVPYGARGPRGPTAAAAGGAELGGAVGRASQPDGQVGHHKRWQAHAHLNGAVREPHVLHDEVLDRHLGRRSGWAATDVRVRAQALAWSAARHGLPPPWLATGRGVGYSAAALKGLQPSSILQDADPDGCRRRQVSIVPRCSTGRLTWRELEHASLIALRAKPARKPERNRLFGAVGSLVPPQGDVS
ncbi:hypothetical protein T492DRAFT_902586, partial [Pavlovales sp. CCMP2436]